VAGYREFVTGEVLTAGNVNDFLMNQAVMVFADAAARNSALGTAIGGANALVEGMLTYNQDSGKLEIYNGTSWAGVSAVKKIAAFTSSGTWTVPAGVTYAIAHILSGGGGAGGSSNAGADGGDSSVAFASGTVTSLGGEGGVASASVRTKPNEKANSGRGAEGSSSNETCGSDSQWIVAGASVTPAASITVTVGSGGDGGTTGFADGGSGYVYIEYYE